MAGCGEAPQSPDELKVEIKLDLREDIGLLLTSWDVSGQSGMSGASNADGSMIKHNCTEYWSFDKNFLEQPTDTVDLTLEFIVVTKYFEPDYSFNYPEEYLRRMEAVSFSADFGKTYRVTITGDNENGYQARLEGE